MIKLFSTILAFLCILTSCSKIYTYFRRNNDTEGKTEIKSKFNDDNIVYTNESSRSYEVHQTLKDREINFKLELLVIPGKMSGGTKIKYKYYYTPEALTLEERITYLNSDVNYKSEITSVMEDVNHIFLHPPRSFSLKSLQLSPFPQIDFPVKKGYSWKAKMFIGSGWGDLNGKTIKYDFIIDEVKYLDNDTLNYTAKVIAKSYVENENHLCNAIFNFDSKLGFTRLRYDFDNTTKIEFNLVE